ncbi:HET domain-containing protein [Trichoderma longibrachiatum]
MSNSDSDSDSDYSSSDEAEASKRCPHQQFRRGLSIVGVGTRVQVVIDASAKCIECKLLLQAVSHFKPGWIEDNKDGTGIIFVEKRKTYTVELLPEPNSDPIGTFQFVHRSKDEPMYENAGNILRPSRAQGLQVIPDSSSQAAMDRAYKWLSHCLEHDEACEIPNKDFMPRMLIDVTSEESSREPFLFEPSAVAPYACLSYCWGSDTEGILRTTTQNVESHHEAIPLAEMPLGVQDAITVCRGLKIPYLWVDSLCIVQDDPVAWLEDASQMDRIYLHSRLTIAAQEPSSCKARFLGAQTFGQPDWQQHFTADIPSDPNEPPLEIFVRANFDGSSEEKEEDVKRSLDKRGWCLQESLLPSRRLCFDGNEMIWECLCRTICECGHILWKPQPFGFGRLGAHLKSKRLKAEVAVSHPQPARPWYEEYHGYVYSRRGTGYPKTPYRRWRDIVSEYSQRSLSQRKDRLSAVSGLAKLVREGLPRDQEGEDGGHAEEYLAGLWKRELHFDLTWTVQHPKADPEDNEGSKIDTKDQVRAMEDDRPRIPSWSWASVEAPVKYHFDQPLDVWKYEPRLIDLVKLESASCERELGHDETSAVTSGEVVLTGLASSVKLLPVRQPQREGNAVVQSANSFSVEVTIDQPASLASLSSHCQNIGRGEENCQREERKGQDEGLICLVLFSWIAPTRKYDSGGKMRKMGPETWFLVLKPCTSVPGAYERIGIGSHSTNSGERCELFQDGQTVTVKIV